MRKKRIKESVVNILKLACMEMIAILLNMVQFYPIVVGFLKSARTGQLGDFSIQIFHSFADIVSYIGRMFSTNFWGNISYSGSMNYYEMGISYLSCLGIITISYFLINKYWKRTTAAIIAYLFMISVTAVSFVLTFTNGYRWTFLLNFVLVICIGKFLDKVSGDIKQKNSIVIYKTIVMADIIFICMLSFLWIIGKKLEMTIDKKAFFQVMCVWGIANVLVFILFYKSRMTLKNIGICIVLFICAEQVFMNYDIVNDRGIVTEKELGTSLYNDGTAQIVDKLEEQDASLYRVNKTYKSVFLNDAYIQGYNGVSDYGSTHGKTLIQFMDSLNIDTPYNHSNYVDISVDEIYVNELLSVKYIIAEESYEPDKEGLIEVWSDGNKIVYEDENTLPFGYIYTKKINYEQCQELDETSERTKALMLGFYYTELTLNKDNAFETIDLSSNNALLEWKTGRDVLINSNVYDIQFRDNVYTANVINDSEKKVMFCVPFIYDENWNAYVDGIEVECYNINGGLIGIEIGNGEHNVKIVYNDKYQELSRTISAISCGIYIVFLGLYFVRQRFVVAGKIMDDKKHRKSKES